MSLITVFGTGRDLLRSAINVSASGDTIVIPARPGMMANVMGYKYLCAAPVIVLFKSEDGTLLSGPSAFGANGGEVAPWSDQGHFIGRRGDAIVLNLSAAVAVGGHIQWVYVGD